MLKIPEMMDSLRQIYETATATCRSNVPSVDISFSHFRDNLDRFLADRGIGMDWPSFHELIVKYGPFLPLIIILWPLVITLIVTAASASTWVFWLFTSVVFGIVQLIYVTYTFMLIFFDLIILSLLKTFAMLRSQIRYFTIKSGLSKRKGGKRRSRRGRRREWRKKLDKADCYDDYLDIEIEEPEPKGQTKESGGSRRKLGLKLFFNKSKREEGASRTAPSNGTGDLGRPPMAPGSGKKDKSGTTDAAMMRKSQSCVNLETVSNADGSIVRVSSTGNILRHSNSDPAGGEYNHESVEAELGITGGMLVTTTARLREALAHATSPPSSPRRWAQVDVEQSNGNSADDSESSLKFLVGGVIKRNHLSVDDLLIEDARSVAECGRHKLSASAREVIDRYNDEVSRCLDWIAESPVKLSQSPKKSKSRRLNTVSDNADEAPSVMERQGDELSDRIHLLRKAKQNMGRTALMLSGGGAQAMYHLGTVRALCESKLYDEIRVISGTSGGSITAAMCAIKTSEELLRDVCVTTVSTDYLHTGQMKRENIRWFPKVVDMAAFWLKKRLMVDSAEFKRCCDFYYGDMTFEEAFERTGKHVCITVSASRASAGSGGGAQRLLLNHISTPHVTIASAVAASCALPGVMAPAKLLMKDSNGKQEPFEVDGVEWIDGSVQADLPFKRISTLFNVSNYVVCQTNFHVVPFLNKAHHPNVQSLYWRTFQTCEWDIRNRVLNLSRLGLFPKFFGQDVSKVFKQKYSGHLTLIPRFTTMQVFGMKALVNPSVKDMEIYLKNGQAAAWPYLTVMKDMVRLERKIEVCIARLEQRFRALTPDYDSLQVDDDVDSLASSVALANRLHFASAAREAELLRQKVHSLELENVSLRAQVEQLQRALGIMRPPDKNGSFDPPLISFTLSEDDEEKEEGDAPAQTIPLLKENKSIVAN